MRLSPKVIRQAKAYNKLLPPLLRPNRTLEDAKRELMWIQRELEPEKWERAVVLRSHHFPLQYILGTQPFGELDIKVSPGVLIPRWETEEWTGKVADLVAAKFTKSTTATKSVSKCLRVLEVCTGTGCISLLLQKKLADQHIRAHIDAIDVSAAAISLANENKAKHGLDVNFHLADVFTTDPPQPCYDLIVSNPPYIPDHEYHSSELSVRLYEPQLALIGDLEFYDRLVEWVVKTDASNFIFELGYESQAQRVRELLQNWDVGVLNDGAGRLRCVVGTRNDTKMRLVDICDEMI